MYFSRTDIPRNRTTTLSSLRFKMIVNAQEAQQDLQKEMDLRSQYRQIHDQSDDESDVDALERNTVLFAGCISIARFFAVFVVFVASMYVANQISSALVISERRFSMPNVFLILIDDLSWNSMGYMPFDMASVAPTMTALARSGTILSNYYTQEHCTPSRAALLTGRYPISLGMQYGDVLPNQEWGLGLNEVLLPQILKEAGGYTNFIFGKWNLGHYSAANLPTARGFDYHLGMLGAEEYYWSKYSTGVFASNIGTNIIDFIEANSTCYHSYRGSNSHNYSTHLYQTHMMQKIENHDFAESPVFLYFAPQAVHGPFLDPYSREGGSGIPASYISADVYKHIMATVHSTQRQQYALALAVLDTAVAAVLDSLRRVGQYENTIVVVASDNGGCPAAGGFNWPLRGTKGSLFEGGTKVGAFISGPRIPAGKVYSSLFHVADWLPTLLDLASVPYSADASRPLDGVSHASELQRASYFAQPQSSLLSSTAATGPRPYILYNAYTNVEGKTYEVTANANAAVRDERYKLIHAYVDNAAAQWYPLNYQFTTTNTTSGDNSTSADEDMCMLYTSMRGNFSRMLFDLQEDPYERVNLYEDANLAAVKERLTAVLVDFAKSAQREVRGDFDASATAFWAAHGGYLQPFRNATDTAAAPILSRC